MVPQVLGRQGKATTVATVGNRVAVEEAQVQRGATVLVLAVRSPTQAALVGRALLPLLAVRLRIMLGAVAGAVVKAAALAVLAAGAMAALRRVTAAAVPLVATAQQILAAGAAVTAKAQADRVAPAS